MCVVFELYYVANNQKIADKKKVDYQETLEKSHADSAARSCDSYMKDPEKSRAQSHESYMKDPEKSPADIAARSREIYEKDLEKSRLNETGLAISYKSKKTAAVIGVGTGGLGGLQLPQLCIKELTVIKD